MQKDLEHALALRRARARINKTRKQLRLDSLLIKLGILPTDDVMALREEKLDAEYAATPMDKKKEFLRHLNEGKNVGQARELAGISLDIALRVLTKNAIELWPTEVKE